MTDSPRRSRSKVASSRTTVPFFLASFNLVSPTSVPATRYVVPRLTLLSKVPPAASMSAWISDRGRESVPVTQKRYDGMIHPFFSLAGIIDGGREAIGDAAAALREASTAQERI